MENIIVKEGGSIERLLSSEVFMARMILINSLLHLVEAQMSTMRAIKTTLIDLRIIYMYMYFICTSYLHYYHWQHFIRFITL